MADPTRDEAPIEHEIRHEIARTLGKAGEALERACAQAWEAYRALTPGDREAGRAYVLAHQEARGRRRNLLLQREAIGLMSHRDVDRCYPLPPPPDSTAARGG
jgi:hypothetical protein